MFLKELIKKHFWLIAIVSLYIVVDMILSLKELYFFNLLPIIVFIVFLALTRLDIIFFIIILLTPLSVQLIDYVPSSSIDFCIPTEPMLFGIMLIFIYKLVRERNFDARILNHPVTYAILFHLFWIFVTSITSSMPLVSFKFLLARSWFIITFYFLAIYIFRKTSNISAYIWCYTISMIVVIIYTTNRHLSHGLFDKQAAHYVMVPFFRDHTSYGAILAMLVFALAGVILQHGKNIVLRFLYWGCLFILILGLVLSYARAAWISVIISLFILILILVKIKFRYVMLAGVLIFFYLIGQRVEIIQKMERNRKESSANISDHIKSISNIKSDESNIERLNRWSSAISMFKERPVFGWGPGTYMFKYGPFQLFKNKTLISTDFGDHGNAHSEYIGPLSEQGVLGPVSFILIVVVSLVTGFRVHRQLEDKHLKQMVLFFLLGFITYIIHGSMNNFLDTDKASALFWGFIAVIVSLDIYCLPEQKAIGSVEDN
jgi:putative inorganic carbon (hco3(-)) transporter